MTSGAAAAVPQTKAIAAIVNVVACLIASFISLCHCRVENKRGTIESREVLGNNCRQPQEIGLASQPWIVKGERSGLLTRIATTESFSSCTATAATTATTVPVIHTAVVLTLEWPTYSADSHAQVTTMAPSTGSWDRKRDERFGRTSGTTVTTVESVSSRDW